ncbi:MAG: peptidyl-prolyl cis-trans isomerase [Flavobacteriaceae bacterium]|nr:peptidyl-prolyl cis-trans isomerase [Flavobacteriaceae bacterium]
MSLRKSFFVLTSFLFFINCEYFSNKPSLAIARMQDKYLFYEDIQDNMPINLSKEDSTIYVNNQITNWAKNHILNDKALINLDIEEQKNLLNLVESYKSDLFSHYYQEKMVKASMDTIILDNQIENYYITNKSNFKLNQDLVKARYIKISGDNYNIKDVRNRFKRFNKDDVVFLDSISLQFSSFSLNDSIWINKDLFFSKFPDIKTYIKNKIIKKSLFYQLEDSLQLYLIKINKSVFRNDIAPLDYIKPTLKQILLNKKKLKFVSDFEKDLIEDALQKKELEFYENN